MVKARLEVHEGTGPLNSPYGVIGVARNVQARTLFFETDICKWIERNRMSYWTNCETIKVPVSMVGSVGGPSLAASIYLSVIAVYLNITEDQFALLKMKLDDPTKLTVIENARD